MLTTLRIKNLALVADLTLEFQPGFCALTGETGAGKSVVLGALKLVLGGRADRSAIRAGADSCSVEAVFDIKNVRAPLAQILEENGIEPCEGYHLLVKRTLTAAGTSRQFINGSASTVAVLGELGTWLVDLHGPHDHQSLLYPARQLAILDTFATLDARREQLAAKVSEAKRLQQEKAALMVDEVTYHQQLDLARFQVHEITDARLILGEEEELDQEHQRSMNSVRLAESCQAAVGLLNEDENAITNRLMQVGRLLHDMGRIDTSTVGFSALQEQSLLAAQELLGELERYGESLQIDAERQGQVEERLNLINSLKRKYGRSIAEILAFGDAARERLRALESQQTEIARLVGEIADCENEIRALGADLTRDRRIAIPRLAKAVTQELSALGFRQSSFDIHLIQSEDATATGFDVAEFQFAPNPGEPARALRAIASSGELARVMLALKTALAAEDDVPVLVFDEVDANVGGETAHVVGQKMRQISQKHQVLCITHLPQVAVHADAHYLVSKEIHEGRTQSRVVLLDAADRRNEIARMLGGGPAAQQHAEELLHPSKPGAPVARPVEGSLF
ncbi:MAG TPA: DNA repair protein RecN [Candidatus Limnocylindria bacterium]|nr:DNA repair protein RecN [Candidatus Limnocylindria bacterium]